MTLNINTLIWARFVSLFIVLLCCVVQLSGQFPDSISRQYQNAKVSSDKGLIIATYLSSLNDDSVFLQTALSLSKQFQEAGDYVGEDYVHLSLNDYLARTGDYISALKSSVEILSRFEKRKDKHGILSATVSISIAYYHSRDRERTLFYDRKALDQALETNSARLLARSYNNLAADLIEYGYVDSGLLYLPFAAKYAREAGSNSLTTTIFSTYGAGYIAKKEYTKALEVSREALIYARTSNNLVVAWTLNDISQIYLETNKDDSARYYARLSIEVSTANGYKDQRERSYNYLATSFERSGKVDSALLFLRMAASIKDSFYTTQNAREVQAIDFREQMRLQEAEQEKVKWKSQLKIYATLAGLFILMIVAGILFRNNKQKQKANKALESALINLKSTQSQLVQSEKMASLGELTAGIAHEIQNPLNFVNNFSDLNTELIDEMSESLSKGNVEEAKDIASTIKENEEKINFHGKRADSIVKGMLQHSRASNGQKEPANINKLADEYLRLAYHGLRAKDKNFNATLITNYDEALSTVPVNLIPQDIGRVILNLITNAFYAVNDHKKAAGDSYTPTVTVSTRLQRGSGKGKVEITVEDNGNGIAPSVLEKIFQPFFTTKPTGQGTGLGLSMSYDIVTKGHGGELAATSSEGNGAKFIISLPV